MDNTRQKQLLYRVAALKVREIVLARFLMKSTCEGKIVPDHEPTAPEIVPDHEPTSSKSEWLISIKGKLDQGRRDNVSSSQANLSIYRFPCYLKNGEDKAWVPQIVSLGPYHHGGKHLHHMEQHKWRCLNRILERSGQEIDLYLDSMKKVEQEARACYEGRISMSSNDFVEMMVLDGCFVIEMIRGFANGFDNLDYPCDDPVFSKQRGLILQIQQDMIMLENQIPLFILDRLLGLQLSNSSQKEWVAKPAIWFFSPLKPFCSFPLMPAMMPTFYIAGSKNFKFNPLADHCMVHCLELLRKCLVCSSKRTRPDSLLGHKRFTRCLTELREAGIKIRRRCKRVGTIKFMDGILMIPPLEIHKWTRSLFLNLIAFEQSHSDCSKYITSYVIFMHQLINSPEDARYLRKHGIIYHYLESDAQVAEFFIWLCQELSLDVNDNCFYDVWYDLEMYYYGAGPLDAIATSDGIGGPAIYAWYICIRSLLALLWSMPRAFLTRKWSAWVAILKSKYFDNPWSIISVIAAFILIVLTFMQTFYAVYAYYRPRS